MPSDDEKVINWAVFPFEHFSFTALTMSRGGKIKFSLTSRSHFATIVLESITSISSLLKLSSTSSVLLVDELVLSST